MLRDKDYKRAWRENAKNGYGFTKKQLMRLIYDHKHGSDHRREYIEERLTDANFHSECGLLMRGDYDAAVEQVKGLF